jgi:uncharacterized protein DUF2683
MESILIRPENPAQLKMIKGVLKALNVSFEAKETALPPHVLASLDRGLQQSESGNTISLDEFQKRHFKTK